MDQFNSSEVIENLKTRLEETQTSDVTYVEEISALLNQRRAALVEEESFLQQKSNVTWFQEGDKNTKFFHASTKQWRTRNRIIGILNEAAVWTEEETEIEQTATTYFQDIFSSSPILNLETSLEHVNTSITSEINEFILRELSAAEVKAAVFAIHLERHLGQME